MPLPDDFWAGEAIRLFEILFPLIRRATTQGAENGLAALQVDLDISWDLVNEGARQWAEAYTYELVTGITETSRAALQEAVSEWISSGKPLDELIRALDESGLWGPVRSEMIAVTEVTRSFAEGNLIGWRESGVVDGKRWATAADDKVCPICNGVTGFGGTEASLDGTFTSRDGVHEAQAPPAHIRCRCWLKPIVSV